MKAYLSKTLISSIITVLLLFSSSYAQTITGKVVGVSDGDTVTVLQHNTQYKIRLYGIDTPESRQDFGTRAKEFASGLVFKKEVQVIQKDIDRYGRIVGIIHINDNDICLNEELIKAGYAWVYRQYCKDGFCRDWIQLETKARESRIGLWNHPNPVPPWEFRRSGKATGAVKAEGVYHGNVKSKVFHQATCKDFNCKNCTQIFHARDDAIKAGFSPCGGCRP